MNQQEISFLNHKAYQLRVLSLLATTQAGSGHPTSCLSAADIVAALFFHAMQYDPQHEMNPNNDRFILSKGHAAPLLYAAWQQAGVVTEKELLTLRQLDSEFEGHPTLRFPRSEAATGSLGQGLSVGVGMALNAHMDERSFRTYVLMGDSELTEGSIWEAAEVAAQYKLNNLIGLVDINRLGQSTPTIHEHDLEAYVRKFSAFGWKTIVVDGHNMQDIVTALDQARTVHEQPVVILAKTFKGYGIETIENKEGFHGKAVPRDELEDTLTLLKKRFPEAVTYTGDYTWQPTIPSPYPEEKRRGVEEVEMPQPHYTVGDMIPTRKAYGQALVALGSVCDYMVALDAEVKNSTYAQEFEKKFPQRFVQCFIAEQNMIGMGVGFAARGKMPFISTFGCFFTRAHDQIRMAAIGWSQLQLVGSHAGVSIGEDGPSQMALEDIAMMRCMPDSVVLYPCDAVSTYRLVQQMANYNAGIAYLRTTRMATPVVYDADATFPIGKCNVLRQSDGGQHKACVVAAGVTVHEALKAHEQLQREGIDIAVIDLYSVKPLDTQTLKSMAHKSHGHIITVEDHYPEGGLGEAVAAAVSDEDIRVTRLAINELPRSGTPAQLMAKYGIDAAAIIKAVKEQ